MQPYEKRQIIEVEFPLDGGYKKHPAVILSVPQVYKQEQYYICAMITSKRTHDQFSFPIQTTDVTKPFHRQSIVRTQLIAQIFDGEIIKDRPVNHFKEDAFSRLIDYINENVFGIPFSYM